MNLDIELVNCDITAFKNGNAKTGSVKLALQAQQLVVILSELATNGGTGTAIMIQAAGKNVPFDGTEGTLIPERW